MARDRRSNADELKQKMVKLYNNERIQVKTKWMPPVKYRKASMG